MVLYVLLPLVAGYFTRRLLEKHREEGIEGFVALLKPWSIVGLLATVILLFGFQAQKIIDQPEAIGMIAVPLLLQTYGDIHHRLHRCNFPEAAAHHRGTDLYDCHVKFL